MPGQQETDPQSLWPRAQPWLALQTSRTLSQTQVLTQEGREGHQGPRRGEEGGPHREPLQADRRDLTAVLGPRGLWPQASATKYTGMGSAHRPGEQHQGTQAWTLDLHAGALPGGLAAQWASQRQGFASAGSAWLHSAAKCNGSTLAPLLLLPPPPCTSPLLTTSQLVLGRLRPSSPGLAPASRPSLDDSHWQFKAFAHFPALGR